jgi:hypothetical protein
MENVPSRIFSEGTPRRSCHAIQRRTPLRDIPNLEAYLSTFDQWWEVLANADYLITEDGNSRSPHPDSACAIGVDHEAGEVLGPNTRCTD